MEAAGKRYIIHPSRSDRFRIWCLADIHWMNRACAEDHIRRDIKTIADDSHSFFVGGGDYVDFIGHRDKRFDPDSVAEWVTVKDLGDLGKRGMRQVRDMLMPIKHKCLGLLIGNHEKRYELQTDHESLHHWLCEELGVRSLEYCALFDIVFLRRAGVKTPHIVKTRPQGGGNKAAIALRVFAHHGAGYAQTPGGKLNRLVQFMQSFHADLFFCGHVHDHVARKEPTIGADATCTKLIEHAKLGVVAGSYLKTYSQGVCTYGEQRGYRPTSLGAATACFRPQTRELTAEV